MKRLIPIFLVFALILAGCDHRQSNMLPPSKASHHPQTPEQIARAEAEIRYAISLLLDRNYIVERISQAGEKPASSFVAMGMADYQGQFYENAGTSQEYHGYFDTDAFSENFQQAISILQKYYDFNGREFLNFPTITYIYNTNNISNSNFVYIKSE